MNKYYLSTLLKAPLQCKIFSGCDKKSYSTGVSLTFVADTWLTTAPNEILSYTVVARQNYLIQTSATPPSNTAYKDLRNL